MQEQSDGRRLIRAVNVRARIRERRFGGSFPARHELMRIYRWAGLAIAVAAMVAVSAVVAVAVFLVRDAATQRAAVDKAAGWQFNHPMRSRRPNRQPKPSRNRRHARVRFRVAALQSRLLQDDDRRGNAAAASPAKQSASASGNDATPDVKERPRAEISLGGGPGVPLLLFDQRETRVHTVGGIRDEHLPADR